MVFWPVDEPFTPFSVSLVFSVAAVTDSLWLPHVRFLSRLGWHQLIALSHASTLLLAVWYLNLGFIALRLECKRDP